MNKCCLITGSSGLIGKWLAKNLIYYHEVVRLNHETCDLSTNFSTRNFPIKVDVVIHLAQSNYIHNFPEYSEDIFTVNTSSTMKLLDYAKRAGASTFIYASSGNVTIEKKPSFYTVTKLCAENLAKLYSPYLDVIIFRPFYVYGPGQKSSRLIPKLVSAIQKGEPILLRGRNGFQFNPIYVTDAVNCFIKAISLTKSETIDIAGPEILTLKDAANIIGEYLNIEPVFKIIPGHAENFVGNIEKQSELFGLPQIPFHEGIKEMLV